MGDSGGSEAWELWAGGSETWIMCQRRLGSAWADDVEVGDGVTERERERVTKREMRLFIILITD